MSITAMSGCQSARVFSVGEVLRSPNHEQAMVQRQLDEVHDELTVVEHERTARLSVGWGGLNI